MQVGLRLKQRLHAKKTIVQNASYRKWSGSGSVDGVTEQMYYRRDKCLSEKKWFHFVSFVFLLWLDHPQFPRLHMQGFFLSKNGQPRCLIDDTPSGCQALRPSCDCPALPTAKAKSILVQLGHLGLAGVKRGDSPTVLGKR